MRAPVYLLLTSLVLLITGCSTTWHHLYIEDADQAERQLAVDEGYCTMAAHGSVPMPQVVLNQANASSSQFAITGQTTGPDGRTFQSRHSGTAFSAPPPSAAFATGFANGVNMGAAIAARKARDKAFEGCMIALGWSDSPVKHSASVPVHTPDHRGYWLPDSSSIYATPEEQWFAEISEFLLIHPEYEDSSELYSALDREVIRLAHELDPATRGTEILLMAHERLSGNDSHARNPLQRTYYGAVRSNAVDQVALSIAYTQGKWDLPFDEQRALTWASIAAADGDPIGLFASGILIFHGRGLPVDRVRGHQLVTAATEAGYAGGHEIIRQLETHMSQDELERVRRGL